MWCTPRSSRYSIRSNRITKSLSGPCVSISLVSSVRQLSLVRPGEENMTEPFPYRLAKTGGLLHSAFGRWAVYLMSSFIAKHVTNCLFPSSTKLASEQSRPHSPLVQQPSTLSLGRAVPPLYGFGLFGGINDTRIQLRYLCLVGECCNELAHSLNQRAMTIHVPTW